MRLKNCSGNLKESVRSEVAFTARLDSAGIRLPGSLPGRGGRFLHELAADHGGGWLRLYRWIDGVPVDLADPGLAVQIGDLARRLHALAWPAEGAEVALQLINGRVVLTNLRFEPHDRPVVRARGRAPDT